MSRRRGICDKKGVPKANKPNFSMPLSTKDALSHIRRLQIKVSRNVNDLFAGIYRSAFKGKGLEFEDVREYQPGDDVRSIDWNVTARSQTPYIKNFREERELTVILMVDISASARFSHTPHLKSEWIAEIGALLAFSAIKNQDKIGLLLFSDEIELYLRPRKGVKHVLRVIRELLYFQPQHKGTNLKKALAFLGRVQKRQAICFLISDFLCADYSHEINLIAKRHELIAIQVYDSYETNFPNLGLLTLRDLESQQFCLVDTSDANVQKHFQEKADQRQLALKHTMEKAKADLITLHSDESYTLALQQFFKYRGRKR
ncbi:DUF58 domain-containing protein [Candidatus Protochlamydia phocaeensis]|uniref:DUF58 domain-containing protein n=1 Tax=Candidatus Protochlamydia phocaeensis TaxID=1414722 RepID=UPI001E593A2D|nr:DUF58 domain-containing protein [Candidatus Protochlamydia phocaeensis]